MTDPARHAGSLLLLGVLVIGPLPLSLWLLAADTRPPISAARALLVILVTWCVIQVCLGLVLGSSGQLHIAGLLAAEATVLVAGLVLVRRVSPGAVARHVSSIRDAISHLDAGEGVIAAALSILWVTLFLRVAATPITDYDSLAYHLPLMARWYQASSFIMLEQFRSISRYPFDWEVLGTLFLLPFGDDFLATLPNLIAWSIFGLSTYLLAVELGAQRIHALACSFLVLAMPIARKHVTTMHVDLALGAFFMAALYFALARRSRRTGFDSAMCLLALAMVAGVKASGLIYCIFILPRLVMMRRADGRKEHARTTAGRTSFVTVAAAGLAGGFWYAKNLIEVGNPLGYVRIGIGSMTLLPGTLDAAFLRSTTLAHVFDVRDASHWSIVIGAGWQQLRLPVVILMLAALALLVRRSSDLVRPRRVEVAVVLGLLVATTIAYWTTPYSGNNGKYPLRLTPWIGQGLRYAFPALGVLTVLATLGATRLPRRSELLAILVVVAVAMTMTSATMLWAAVLVVCGGLAVMLPVRVKERSAVLIGVRRVSIGFLCVAFMFGTLWLRRQRDTERSRVYGGVSDFVTARIRKDEALGYLLSHASYLFYGKDLRTRVVYVPARDDGLQRWLERLQAKKVVLIALGPLPERWRRSKELAWLTDPDGPFTRVFGRDATREPVVYRLRASGG